MKRLLLSLILTAAALGLLLGVGPSTARAQEIRITWIGQACYMIEGGGATVIVDPPAATIGYELPATPANVVTISHNHGDHNNSAGVRGDFTLVDGRPAVERTAQMAAGLPFVLIPGFHDAQGGAMRGRNTIIRWSQGGLNFAHFGDYGQDRLTAEQLADLRNIDVAFVPAGGFFTIDAAGAASLLNEFRPRVAVLMHFRTALGGPAQLAAFPAIKEPFPQIVYKPATTTLSRAQLPAEPEVWLLEVAANLSVVNAASFTSGAPVAPGSLASAFGDFTGAERQGAASLPLGRQLGNTEVLVGDTPAPMVFSSSGQVNFQVPSREAPGQRPVEVRVGGQRVARGSVTILDRAPGLFLVLNQDGSRNSPSNPARRGQLIQILATGQGKEVSTPVADGAAAPSAPSVTNEEPGVFLEGIRQPVRFSGLIPGTVGLWRIDAAIAADAPAGPEVSLVVLSGTVSNILTIAVQ
jgi:uncharacterized protein (TIGR03437 family)